MYCKKCGKELEDNAVFCPFCGQKQNDEITKNVGKENGSISDKKLILVGGIVAALILAVIGIVKLTGKGNEQADVKMTVMKEDVEEEKNENTIPKNATESKDEKLEEAMEDIAEETETVGDLQENENSILKYMKVGDSEEYWYDEDGDLVKIGTDWQTIDIQYVTDAEGNKVYGDRMYEEQMYEGKLMNMLDNILHPLEATFSTWYNINI